MLNLITNKTKTTILGMTANRMGNKGFHTSKIKWQIKGGFKIKLENKDPTNLTIRYVKWYAISKNAIF